MEKRKKEVKRKVRKSESKTSESNGWIFGWDADDVGFSCPCAGALFFWWNIASVVSIWNIY